MTSQSPQQPFAADAERLPIVEEHAEIGKETIETGSVRLSSSVIGERALVTDSLAHVQVSVERHPVDRLMEDAPVVRTEPGRTIVPVFEEVLVKRFRVTEEVHLVSERSEEPVEQEVLLRRTQVNVERLSGDDQP